MSTFKAVAKEAAKLGATVEDDIIGNTHECRIQAPHRKFWCEGGVHEMVDISNRPWKPDYAGLISRMSYGLEDCTDTECEWCNPQE